MSNAISTVTSDAYDATKTYAIGDFCIYNNTLYRCTTAITTAEAWTASHWEATTIADQITDLNTNIVTIHSISSDLGTVTGGYISFGKIVIVNTKIVFTETYEDTSVACLTGLPKEMIPVFGTARLNTSTTNYNVVISSGAISIRDKNFQAILANNYLTIMLVYIAN